jgi:putative ABC transport system substrate-binding protein
MIGMRRREFIALLGGAAAWPLVARAQQAMPVVGFLSNASPDRSPHFANSFRQGLAETGYVEGRNVRIEYRYAEGQRERLPTLAADLVRSEVAVIAAGPGADQAAKAATGIIPIVFMSGDDPVKMGLVASLNRPGGNLTGVTMFAEELEAKRLGLLHDLVPQATTIVVLVDSNRPGAASLVQGVQAAGRRIGLEIQVAYVAGDQEFDGAFATIVREHAGALIVASSSYFNIFRDRLVKLAASHRIPAMYEIREFAEAGGLMSYAPNVSDNYRKVGIYVGRILKGERPAELPVQTPVKYEFVINLKTARALGLDIPPGVLAIADEVIE